MEETWVGMGAFAVVCVIAALLSEPWLFAAGLAVLLIWLNYR